MIWWIVIGILVIGLLSWLGEKFIGFMEVYVELLGRKSVIIILILSILAFFIGSFPGAIMMMICGTIVGYIGKSIANFAHERNIEKLQIEEQKRITEKLRETHENDIILKNVLQSTCTHLGYMPPKEWEKKLGNYKNKEYTTSFEEITQNFAKQMKEQYLIQYNGWFRDFLLYIVNNPSGTTITKMLSEVYCNQLRFTHVTPDRTLVERMVNKACERTSEDVPALLQKLTYVDSMEEYLYGATKYAERLYGNNNEENVFTQEEINFDDL